MYKLNLLALLVLLLAGIDSSMAWYSFFPCRGTRIHAVCANSWSTLSSSNTCETVQGASAAENTGGTIVNGVVRWSCDYQKKAGCFCCAFEDLHCMILKLIYHLNDFIGQEKRSSH
ncbi:uncharacterized protein MELLADRAFT_123537 [Melampsora larici-populina 98AG31]|uniref:Secreted protein n=1 Tax=Melampsora larici-populina (strain 98AG31 / pathotype 3-4-7) TaxID=747676 RepID=F4RBS1_MELLP|nr:uncharacterized protein MELLADRAFT_123537 [Melampsora larici-populina 98AG31]EGG10152.1 secreted protein [Melampsora larici-populina 98AG31]